MLLVVGVLGKEADFLRGGAAGAQTSIGRRTAATSRRSIWPAVAWQSCWATAAAPNAREALGRARRVRWECKRSCRRRASSAVQTATRRSVRGRAAAAVLARDGAGRGARDSGVRRGGVRLGRALACAASRPPASRQPRPRQRSGRGSASSLHSRTIMRSQFCLNLEVGGRMRWFFHRLRAITASTLESSSSWPLSLRQQGRNDSRPPLIPAARAPLPQERTQRRAEPSSCGRRV